LPSQVPEALKAATIAAIMSYDIQIEPLLMKRPCFANSQAVFEYPFRSISTAQKHNHNCETPHFRIAFLAIRAKDFGCDIAFCRMCQIMELDGNGPGRYLALAMRIHDCRKGFPCNND